MYRTSNVRNVCTIETTKNPMRTSFIHHFFLVTFSLRLCILHNSHINIYIVFIEQKITRYVSYSKNHYLLYSSMAVYLCYSYFVRFTFYCFSCVLHDAIPYTQKKFCVARLFCSSLYIQQCTDRYIVYLPIRCIMLHLR